MSTSIRPPTTVLGHSPAQATATQTPPISEILTILSRTFSTVASFSVTSFSFLFQTSKSVARGAFWPLSPISSIVAYILAPLFVFFSIAADILLLTPYNVLLNILHALYPVYVFCGVAFITAVIVGMFGRALISILQAVLFEGKQELEKEEEFEPQIESPIAPKKKQSTHRRKRVKVEE